MPNIRKQTTNEPREKQMRAEYIAKYLMGQRWMTEYRLGNPTAIPGYDVLSPSDKAALGIRRPFADLVVFLPDKLQIFEFQIRSNYAKFGQLLVYTDLAKNTDELREWWNKPIEGILVDAVRDPMLEYACRKYGLLYTVYTPDWLHLYLDTLRPRQMSPTQVSVPGSVQ